MVITKRRIRNLDLYIDSHKPGDSICVALPITHEHTARLLRAGFSPDLMPGERILPHIVGRVSEYNAEGRQFPQRHLPMETAYRQVLWEWQDWQENDYSEIVDVPYQRYPRLFVPPPSLELQISLNDQGQTFVASDPIVYASETTVAIVHAVNLFLELFGACHILGPDLTPQTAAPVKRLNWEVLPQGQYPWSRLKQALDPILQQVRERKQPVLHSRLTKMSSLNPEFVAVGQGGFSGYVIFGFPKANLYILESAFYGNATYVLESNWEQISQLTKAEILNAQLHRDRIIHLRGWDRKIDQLMRPGS